MKLTDKAISKKFNQYMVKNMLKWINDTILNETIRAANAANLPQPFIDHIRIEKSKNRYELVNDWTSEDGAPLSIFFNDGTIDHYIQPKNPDGVLAWGGKGGTHAKAIFFKSGKKSNTLFSKGHYVSGLPKTEAMQNGFKLGKIQLQRKIKSEMKKFSKGIETRYNVKVNIT